MGTNITFEEYQQGVKIGFNNVVPQLDFSSDIWKNVDWENVDWNNINIDTNVSSGYNNDILNRSLEERKRDVLNSGGGYNCGLCKGTGKCFNCKGTGVSNNMGITKKCVSCKDAPGVCSQCHGTKVSSWNR